MLMGLTAMAAAAQVEDGENYTKTVNLCSGSCYEVKIKNASSATVMSTDIIRNSTGGKCDKDSIKVKQNNTGNNAVPNSEIEPYIIATLGTKCAYEIKFNVSNGCTGDTRARIKEGKRPTKVLLDKNCGTLKTIKNY